MCVCVRSLCRDRPLSLCNAENRSRVPTTEPPILLFPLLPLFLLSPFLRSSSPVSSSSYSWSSQCCPLSNEETTDGAREAWNTLNEANDFHWAFSKAILTWRLRLGFVIWCEEISLWRLWDSVATPSPDITTLVSNWCTEMTLRGRLSLVSRYYFVFTSNKWLFQYLTYLIILQIALLYLSPTIQYL